MDNVKSGILGTFDSIPVYRHICRAKDIHTKKWVYGYYVALPEEYSHGKDIVHAIFSLGCEHICMGEYKDYGWHEVDPTTVCLSTNHFDRHDNLIFENDIVGFGRADSYRQKELVWYCKEMGMLTSVPLDGIEFNGYDYWNGKYPHVEYSTLCLMLQDPYGDFSDIKVIGNIIDNPKLLEV